MKATMLAREELLSAEGTEAGAGFFARVFGGIKRSIQEHNLREELARLDDALLRDIGIGEDEIWRVRSRERFTPRAWR